MIAKVQFLRLFKIGRKIYRAGEIAEVDIPENFVKLFEGKFFKILERKQEETDSEQLNEIRPPKRKKRSKKEVNE